ncbi:MAG: hypothetical protein KTR30_02985 [Saprospiraceae bacterium]|nr:hypothetical protein [Saprospiraceae bacterium]
MNRRIGIWLDYRNAYIIYLQEDKAAVEELISTVEDFHPAGGSTSKTPWGPQDNIKEKKYLERKKQQLQRYFQAIIQKIQTGDQLYIFGPAEAKLGLQKALDSNRNLAVNLHAVETADQMTLNQKIAQVKGFFRTL